MLEFGYDLVTGGTDNHLILIDLQNKNVPGKVAAQALDRANIVANYNMVPFDPRKPFDPSGLRLGTPAVTSRGMKEEDMIFIAEKMNEVISNHENEEIINKVKGEVTDFCKKFPAPGILLD